MTGSGRGTTASGSTATSTSEKVSFPPTRACRYRRRNGQRRGRVYRPRQSPIADAARSGPRLPVSTVDRSSTPRTGFAAFCRVEVEMRPRGRRPVRVWQTRPTGHPCRTFPGPSRPVPFPHRTGCRDQMPSRSVMAEEAVHCGKVENPGYRSPRQRSHGRRDDRGAPQRGGLASGRRRRGIDLISPCEPRESTGDFLDERAP